MFLWAFPGFIHSSFFLLLPVFVFLPFSVLYILSTKPIVSSVVLQCKCYLLIPAFVMSFKFTFSMFLIVNVYYSLMMCQFNFSSGYQYLFSINISHFMFQSRFHIILPVYGLLPVARWPGGDLPTM